jgi:hypothetical protein
METKQIKSQPVRPPYPGIDEIMAFEDQQLDNDQIVDLFVRLINSGMIYHLQGFYGRTANSLISGGHIVKDEYGNAIAA